MNQSIYPYPPSHFSSFELINTRRMSIIIAWMCVRSSICLCDQPLHSTHRICTVIILKSILHILHIIDYYNILHCFIHLKYSWNGHALVIRKFQMVVSIVHKISIACSEIIWKSFYFLEYISTWGSQFTVWRP